jgi:hypothetical protein
MTTGNILTPMAGETFFKNIRIKEYKNKRRGLSKYLLTLNFNIL